MFWRKTTKAPVRDCPSFPRKYDCIFLLAGVESAADDSLQNVESASGTISAAKKGTYTNPLPVQIPNDGMVESCADPSIIYSQTPGDNYWYMFCTTDPLNDEDKTGDNF